MTNSLPAIVVVAYNRPLALKRLLGTIASANYQNYSDIPLIISIDRGDCQQTVKAARDFVWQHGTKRIIEHEQNLGLRRHIITCGDLTQEYGAAIVLEDDLLVSPEFYHYTVEAIACYENSAHLAGISLYAYDFNEYAESKFIPLEDGYDNYFIQTACSWGQAWTANQWQKFKQWYDTEAQTTAIDKLLPQKLHEWSENSWKKYFISLYRVAFKKKINNQGDSNEVSKCGMR